MFWMDTTNEDEKIIVKNCVTIFSLYWRVDSEDEILKATFRPSMHYTGFSKNLVSDFNFGYRGNHYQEF